MKPVTPRRRRPKSVPKSVAQQNGSDRYQSKAIARALDVLETLNADSSLSLAEISQRIGLPASTLFRILVTLHSRGYVHQDEAGTYRLMPKMAQGGIQDRAEQMKVLVHPRLQELARQFEETASSAFLFDDTIRVIDTVESGYDIRMTNRIGRILPPYASSLAKSITAYQDRLLRDRLIDIYGLFRQPRKRSSIAWQFRRSSMPYVTEATRLNAERQMRAEYAWASQLFRRPAR